MRRILASTIVKEHKDDYSIVLISPNDEENARTLLRNVPPWFSITYAGDEVSVVLRSSDWARLSHSFPGHRAEGPYRLITFDIILDLSIVGFLSVISTVLADSGISIYAVSTFLKDHILVKKQDTENAVAVLEGIIAEAKRE